MSLNTQKVNAINKLEINKSLFIKNYSWYKKYIDYINSSNCQNKSLIIFLLIIEKMNRGDLINILLEKTLLLILPSLVKSLNLSIGHFQIKYSFLRKYAPIVNIKNLFDLNYCINVIDNFLRTYKHLSNSEKIKLFHSGDPSSKTCSAMVYVELYKWYVDYYSLETE